MQPSEIDKLPYYEYEWWTQEIQQINKEQEKQNEAQQKEYESMQHSMNPNTMMKSMQKSMPNLSSQSMSLPKINMPKL